MHLEGEMVRALIFDFLMAGLALGPFALLVWLWTAFREDLGLHPIYRQPGDSAAENHGGVSWQRGKNTKHGLNPSGLEHSLHVLGRALSKLRL